MEVEDRVQPLSARSSTRRWGHVARFLVVMGPGIITANVDNDAGGITTYSLAGARYGYALVWTLVPITIALVVVQEMCARMGAITGKGLADLIRERFGVRVTFYAMALLVLSNVGNTASEFAGVASSLEIFGVPRWATVPAVAAFVWWLVVYGSYRSVEKVFLVACVFYLSYVASGVLARPGWGIVLHETLAPRTHVDAAYVTMLVGLVGTTIAPWMQFYQQSAIVEKGVRAEDYAYSRLDVVTGCIFTDVVAFFIIVACAATLHRSGVAIETAADAAEALRPLAGRYCAALFAFGLFNASLFSASVLPLATAYSVCEAFGWETGVNKRVREAPQFYGLYTGLIVLGALIILVPGIPLVPVMYLSQVANGILLPVVLVFMLLLVNRRDLMGSAVNGSAMNAAAWVTVVVTSALAVYLGVATLASGWTDAAG
jgi:NRAMP (natural resistance-associated macrophage protein)-like metal ion transporter